MQTFIDNIARTTTKLLIKEPFYGHFCINILKEELQDGTITITLTGRDEFCLKVNSDFWNSLNNDQQYGVLKHQLLHIVFKHVLTYKKYADKQLFGIAADLVVNQYILKEQLLPESILLEHFPFLKPDMDVGYYYKKLKLLLNDSTETENNDDQLGEGINNNEEKNPDNTEDRNQANQTLIQLLANDTMDQHEGWQALQNNTDDQNNLIEYEIMRRIVDSIDRANGIGSLPGKIQAELQHIHQQMVPKLNWKHALRIFAKSSMKTRIKSTIMRPSTRYGTIPGIKVVRMSKLLVAIDTSGSVSEEDFYAFFHEIHSMYRQKVEIFIVECDIEIINSFKYTGKVPKKIHGRGGTSFDAPFEFAKTYKPDGIIYFTDGYGSHKPHTIHVPVFWLITKNGASKEEAKHLKGRVVKIE